ncbi:MAG: response regulator transcription factor [Fusobacteriota bacterium]
MKIAVIEDDEEIRDLIKFFLNKENYDFVTAKNGLEGLKVIKKDKPDLILLDLMLPQITGIDLCKIVRSDSAKYGDPIILMLTAKVDSEDVLKGFEAGADDYIKKPFNPRELMARIKRFLTRYKKETMNIYNYKNIQVNLLKYTVTESGKERKLSKKEFDTFLFLLKNKGTVLTRNKILTKVWGSEYYEGDRTVDVYMSKLREKLSSIKEDIVTVKGVGYKLREYDD